MAKPYDYIMKILLIGDSSVGKPQILLAYAEEHFSSNFISTTGIDFKLKNIELAGKKIKLQIWDTAGQERFRSITTAYFRGAMGIMLVYDITNKTSFQNVELWLKQIKQYAQENTQVILVGNKCDLNHLRQVQKDEGEKIAASYGIKFMEVSAKKRINIDEAFLTLAEDILAVLSKQVTEEHLGHLAGNKAPRDSESGKDKSIFKRLFQPFIVGMAQAATSVPEEIQQDPYALDLYERALRDGTEKDRSIRINIVGNYRQGKTSLMRRLLGQKVSDVSSTNGIDVIHYKCMRTSDGKLSFRRAEEKDKSDIVERLLSVALAPKHEQHEDVPGTTNTEIRMSEPKLGAVTNTPQTQKSDFPESADLNKDEEISLYTEHLQKGNTNAFDVDKASSGNIEATKRGKNESKKSVLSATEKETFTRELSKRKVQTSTKETQTLFDMWDFGGQHIFYATHTLFHSENAIYLLVFDLTLALDTVIVDEDFPEESSNKDMEYFLHFWMNSIHSFVGSVDGSRPKVILVGTHKDKVKGNAKAKRHYIEQYFSKIRTSFDGTKLLNHIHSEDFSVDNSIGNDDAVFQLRETIISLGNAQSKTIEIPAKWIQLEKALTDRKHIKIIPFELVLAIDEQNEVPVGDPEEIKLFLRYHHSKGTYIYFEEEPLSQHVVLEPQYLIDAFKCIITTERFCTNDPEIRPLWKMLQTDGRLEEALIDRQWGKDMDKMFMEHKYILISFLIKYNIISEATDFDDRTQRLLRLGWFVVPSLLKANLPHTEIRQFLNRKKQTIVKFVMFFDNSTIVPTIYHRLMAALIGKWPVAQLGKKALISKDKCVVRLNMDHAGIGEMKFDTIELTVVNLCPSSAIFPEQADIFRRFSEALIIHEFSKLGRKHEYHRKPYSTWYRCNHESHDDKGSMKIAEIATLNDEKLIPCPDLISHDIDARKAEQEWFLDHRTNLATSNSELNDKVLSKMSTCIGKNWQLLGLELGVAQVQIEQISEDYPNSTAMRIYNMLKFWRLHTTDSANFNVLVEAMQNCPQVSIHWDGIRNIVDGMN